MVSDIWPDTTVSETNKHLLVIHTERNKITGRGHRGISHIRAFVGFGSAEIDTNPDPFSPQQPNLTFHWITFNWTTCGRVWETTADRKRDTRYWRQLWERTLVTVILIYLHYQSPFVLIKTLSDATLTLRQSWKVPHEYSNKNSYI